MNRTIDTEYILTLTQGFMESRILLSAAELNLFSVLTHAPITAQEISVKIGCDTRALTTLLDAVAAMELLTKSGQEYHCEGPVAQLLSEDNEGSILPMVLHMASLWSRWSHLTDIVRGVKQGEFNFSRDPAELRSFIGAMHSIGAPLAKKIVAAVDPGDFRMLLDIGGGSGTYTMAFLRAVPEMRATLFDLPPVIELARERLAREGLLDRTNLVEGSYHDDELPEGHDLALLSAIIHSNSDDENLKLYNKIFRALNSGGRILIRDHVMEPDRTRPRSGAIFAVNMLAGTKGGGSYTYEEIASGLQQAGFAKIRLLQQGEQMDAVVEAFKP